jgi:acyl-CoA synthetase (AMP-forming)/AMP-acid ligase II
VLRGILERDGRPPTTPRTLLSVPLFHVTGEVPVMINSFVIGRCMVVMPKWDATEALRLIEKERITYFVGVPTMSLELMNHPDRHKYDLSSLSDITAGGAPRPVTHVERLKAEFPNAQPALGYGLTETNAAGFSNFWGNYAAKPASTGRAQVPYIEAAILGPDDKHVAAGKLGEIAIRSAANIKCYWRNPEATDALFTADGYVRTGDIGYLDEDGYLFIVDRKKEIIIRGGENISAAEVEAACYACPSIAEVSVFGAPDERLGEVPVAIVYLNDGARITEEGLRGFLDGQLAKFKIPERFIFSSEPLPRLGTGKIDRRALKAQYAN